MRIFTYTKKPKIPDFTHEIKKYMSVTKCSNLRNLVLGSSHGRDGFIPGNYDFNLSGTSLDLWRIWNLYKYVVKHNGKNIKRVIVFYSVFHPGLQLERTQEWTKCIPYKKLYDIDYAFPLPVDDTFMLNALDDQIKKFTYQPGFRGKSSYGANHNSPVADLVEKHLKNTMRNNNQIQYLENIAKLAREKHHKMYVVLPPYRSDYLKLLPDDKTVFHELFEFLTRTPDVTLLNFEHDQDFQDDDFDSPDHCNENGGKKLTTKIRTAIRKKII
ncbi:MAG: hypothetical protein J5679_01895 [Alphaproteobacteria bacterium]|nr:hypothetical protein [Alphaproteobacteria bacterium]